MKGKGLMVGLRFLIPLIAKGSSLLQGERSFIRKPKEIDFFITVLHVFRLPTQRQSQSTTMISADHREPLQACFPDITICHPPTKVRLLLQMCLPVHAGLVVRYNCLLSTFCELCFRKASQTSHVVEDIKLYIKKVVKEGVKEGPVTRPLRWRKT